jgi:bifunctional DNA-binding transcriptional regulator/antitoxin component of YhaV-PrlF toxin-antitoxin module
MGEKKHSFRAVIEEGRGGGALVAIPFDVRETFGTSGQVKVVATFDGEPYRGSIAPMGGGRHVLGIQKGIRQKIGKDIGDRVEVVVQRDTEPRTVETPDDLAKVLKRAAVARQAYEKLSYTHRKEYVRWIEEANKPETRARRVEKAIAMLVEGKTR